jgi:hypothetical protein
VSRIVHVCRSGVAVTLAVTGPAAAEASTGAQFSMKKNVANCAYVPWSAGGLVDTAGDGNTNRDRAISANTAGSTNTGTPPAAGGLHVVSSALTIAPTPSKQVRYTNTGWRPPVSYADCKAVIDSARSVGRPPNDPVNRHVIPVPLPPPDPRLPPPPPPPDVTFWNPAPTCAPSPPGSSSPVAS